MKRYLVLTSLFIGLFVHAQTYVKEKSIMAASSKHLDISSLDFLGENLLISGSVEDSVVSTFLKIDSSLQRDVFLAIVDSNLNLVSQELFSHRGNQNVNELLVTRDQNFLLTGYSDSPISELEQQSGCYLLQFSKELKMLKKKGISDNPSTYITSLQEDSLGNIYCVGQHTKEFKIGTLHIDSTRVPSMFILKLDKELEPLELKQIKSAEKLELLNNEIVQNQLQLSVKFRNQIEIGKKRFQSDSLLNSLVFKTDGKEFETKIFPGSVQYNAALSLNEAIDEHSSVQLFGESIRNKEFSAIKNNYLFLKTNTQYQNENQTWLYQIADSNIRQLNFTHQFSSVSIAQSHYGVDSAGHVYIADTYLRNGKKEIQLSKYFNCQQARFEQLEPIHLACEGEEIELELRSANHFFVQADSSVSQKLKLPKTGLIQTRLVDHRGCSTEQFLYANYQQRPRLADSVIRIPSNEYAHDGEIELRMKESKAYQYQWSNGAKNSKLKRLKPGSYQVKVIDSLSGCSADYSFELSAIGRSSEKQKSSGEIQFDYRYLNEQEVTFVNLSTEQYSNFQWQFGDGTSSYESQPTHEYQDLGLYQVCLKGEDIYGDHFSSTQELVVGTLTATQVERLRELKELGKQLSHEQVNLLTYPNPMKNYCCVAYHLPEDAEVGIELYNARTLEHYTIQKLSKQTKGVNKLLYENKHNLSAGIYQLILTVDGVRYNFALEVE